MGGTKAAVVGSDALWAEMRSRPTGKRALTRLRWAGVRLLGNDKGMDVLTRGYKVAVWPVCILCCVHGDYKSVMQIAK